MSEVKVTDTHVSIQMPLDGPVEPHQLYQRGELDDPVPNPYLQYDTDGLWIVTDLDDETSVRKTVLRVPSQPRWQGRRPHRS